MAGRYLLRHRPLDGWPGPRTRNPKWSPFTASWSATLTHLDRELEMLAAVDGTVVLQVDVPESACRNDGQLRADARPRTDGVILSFEAKGLGPLSYPCDRFTGTHARPGWQANVRAIALGLEALRRVDRYGIAPGRQQYTGWRQLAAGVPLPPPAMSIDEAAAFLVKHSGWESSSQIDNDIIGRADDIDACYRNAAKRLHPDAGGDAGLFRRLNDARMLLLKDTLE